MKLRWDLTGERLYETGVKNGVIYPYDKTTGSYNNGVAWNGLTGVTESPSGAEPSPLYADNIKYLNLVSAEEFAATVEAYMYPDVFANLDGSAEISNGVRIGQQARGIFGLCYRTEQGNDIEMDSYGYKLHLIYGATASPSEKAYTTINDSPEAITFSWELNTTPVSVTGYKPTANVTIDSTKVSEQQLRTIENILYGTDGTESFVAASMDDVTNPAASGLYELVGDNYVLTTDTTADSDKTYYERTISGGTAPRLPLPDEIVTIFAQG